MRATALLTPLATPARRCSTAASTVAVSGATIAESPSPNTRAAGSTSMRYEAPGPIRAINSMPAAATRRPAVMGRRGPMRCATAPARAD
ncbi:MAG: hypothetical protein HOQ24_11380, partial [Mycobacteriaceae bacterium]|nr:hypothetical protein [Mycobacteriaceae bacterium]